MGPASAQPLHLAELGWHVCQSLQRPFVVKDWYTGITSTPPTCSEVTACWSFIRAYGRHEFHNGGAAAQGRRRRCTTCRWRSGCTR